MFNGFVRRLAAVVVFALAAAGLGAAPAVAAPGCVSGAICFHNTSTSTPNYDLDAGDTYTGECNVLPSGVKNTTSYITNRNGYRWYVYNDSFCSAFPAGTIYPNSSGAMSSPWNNNIESFKRA
jgi:hypothetical protein